MADAPLLLIVDVQAGFINRHTRALVPVIEDLQHRYASVVATRFVNPPGSPHRRWIGWTRFAPDSADIALAFRARDDARIIDKTAYTCVTPDFLAELAAAGIAEVHLCGIATDACVLVTAVDLFQAGIRPVVLTHACASHGGPAAHAAALRLLPRLIGREQVV